MALYRHSSESIPEKRGIIGAVFKTLDRSKHGLRVVRRGTRFGRISIRRFLFWMFSVAVLFSIYLAVFGLKMQFHGNMERGISSLKDVQKDFLGSDALAQPKRKPRRQQFYPCEVGFLDSVNNLVEPKDYANITQFSSGYVYREEKPFGNDPFEPRFGGHQTLEEREKSFYARNQTIHCGFVKGPEGYSSSGFDLDEKDKSYMNTCRVVVSSCIFGSSDFLRRPASKLISEYSKKNVCFVMFVDEQTLLRLSADRNVPDERGYIGLWRIVIVRSLPYKDMRKTGKVPKFLSHRLFPSSRYSIWLDSKMRLQTDPMLIIEYFLWRTRSEYAISNHYTRHCVWEEVLQNKRLNKYNHTAIDEQFIFYQSDGLTKFDPSDLNTPLPSYVPEGSFIVRAHTPMSNLFSCLWFNEVDRFTSRDQLSFAYTFLKLKRMNPDRPFFLNMFKDCERRALAKLFRHRAVSPPPAS
ncbi:probable hexosyltransferase MUCI70 isoform X1 [Actinidia eriantha]|uniref:probable hexosyltransferase MUCI70 isoform X1 n=1 Tax=Actinidia eriantha TaxID=165200 RepID=UPI00258C018A|nr:probable hexosyltransferase MUCI70 isoform X1 [Actinidia eriantha]XP_057484777.1 probable hexosyltransferase MUCI70 isoform X1 [Actinidia eriantha]XP_057484778.1 probable hexosyltransferase MUCI70 isoform X1 [Actinidia eriantha]